MTKQLITAETSSKTEVPEFNTRKGLGTPAYCIRFANPAEAHVGKWPGTRRQNCFEQRRKRFEMKFWSSKCFPRSLPMKSRVFNNQTEFTDRWYGNLNTAGAA